MKSHHTVNYRDDTMASLYSTVLIMDKQHYYPTVWLSDIHLGYKDCKADYLLRFLNNSYIDTLYLVGDIVDLWALNKRIHWPAAHQNVLDKLIYLSEHGTKVIYIPGNHDAPLRHYSGLQLGNIELVETAIHSSINGKQYLVIHGDQFDAEVLCYGKWFSWVGDKAYDFLLWLNRINNSLRKLLGLNYWSLAGHLKDHVKSAKAAITRYKKAGCAEAKRQTLDGIICGHIHYPEVDVIDGIEYYNDGAWIENCSALTESEQGEINLLFWTETSVISDISAEITTLPQNKAA